VKRRRILRNPPNEMMTASAQQMQRFDPVAGEKARDRFAYWRLQIESALGIQKCFVRPIEVDVFHIEIGNERAIIPKRARNFGSFCQKALEIAYRAMVVQMHRARFASREKTRRALP
jgi:hypothetical protein